MEVIMLKKLTLFSLFFFVVVFINVFNNKLFCYSITDSQKFVNHLTEKDYFFPYKQTMVEVVKSVAIGLSNICYNKTEEEQIRIISDFIEDVRFFKNKTGYFYVYNYAGVSVAHATQKDLVNENLYDYKDSNGKYVIQELSKTAKMGGGFVDFRWQKPDGTPDKQKLGYVYPINNTDFFIGSGVYLPDNNIIVAFAYAKPPFVFATPPFCYDDYDIYTAKMGIELALVKESLASVGYNFTPVYYSYDELDKGLKNGSIEVAATVRNKLKDIYYSQEFVYFKNVIVTKKKKNIKIETFNDLADKSVVTWEGASQDLGSVFYNAIKNNDNYFEIGNQAEQGAFFFNDKADVIVIDKTIFQWWLSEFSDKFDTSEDYEYHNLFPDKTVFYVGFKSKELRNLFDEGLSIIKKNGLYNDIMLLNHLR